MRNKKFILIENLEQGLEYLKQKEKFKGFLPITFSFGAEELLLKNKINFKMDDDYETDFLYKDVYKTTLKNTEKICDRIKINYRGIDLMQLFYMDLFEFLGMVRRYLRLLEKIKKVENPEEIIVFKDQNNSGINDEICLRLAQEIFKKKINEVKYVKKNKKKPFYFKIGGFMQKVFSRINLSLTNKNDHKIFFDDSKVRFEPLLKELLNNKNNKIFRCKDHLQKSFFIDKKYIPFYNFEGMSHKLQKDLIKDILIFKQDKNSLQFLNQLNMPSEIISLLKVWIKYYVLHKFFEISYVANEIISLIEKKKIDFVIVFADVETFDKLLVQVAKKYGVPSIVVQHGVLGYKFGFSPFSASYFFTFGKNSEKRLIKFGFSKESIILAGAPQFDKYLDKKTSRNPKKRIVFITSCADSDKFFPEVHLTKKQQKKIFRMLFNALKKFPEYKLIVKGRKGWDMNELSKAIAKEENFTNIEYLIEGDSLEFLADSDIVIINNTTMAFDALLLDKPVISISFKGENSFFYEYSDVIENIYNQKQLESAIRNALVQTKKKSLKRKKCLEEEVYKLDGKASQRITDFINKLLLNKKNRNIRSA